MKYLLSLLQLVCLLTAVEGKTPVRKGVEPQYGTAARITSVTLEEFGNFPEPTVGPNAVELRKRSDLLEKRAGETCGYINGQSSKNGSSSIFPQYALI
jgi:hypothetical protein